MDPERPRFTPAPPDQTVPVRPQTARCPCGHTEDGVSPFLIAQHMVIHWRTAHTALLEAPFLRSCEHPGCGRATVARYCCAMCHAADDGGPPLAPWNAAADPVEVHEQACEIRARVRDLVWPDAS